MPDMPVEEAVKANCQAVLTGDLMRIMQDLTPEALGKLMSGAGGGGNMGAMPALTSFDIQSHDQQGEDHVFKVKFSGDADFTAIATWRDVAGQWKIADLALEQPAAPAGAGNGAATMSAQEFMQAHADNACAGKMGEVMKDLTPESMAQVGPLMAGAPNPVKTNKVVPVREEGDAHIFDVSYFGEDGKSVSMRETVRQVEGTWKIVKLERPS